MKHLQIAEGLRFPLSAVEDVVAILGRRGRGKTTTAAVIVEELHAAGARFCVADPTGVWWGLKSSRDGKRAGIPVIVMGGEPGGHGDVPLAVESGSVIADFVAEPDSPSCVLDLHHFSQADLVRFMTAFLSRLYQKNTHPLHLVLDEADQFAPQRPMPGETAMLGAAQRVTKMGRVKGLHPILITQRPATLSKNVLTQAGTLIAHAITGPQDRNAVDEWVKANAGEGERATFLATLPTLPRGTAYVWNPDLPLFQRVAIRDRQTFDSSSTPTGNAERAQPKTLAEVDLRALEARIADTIERAKADDPRELRKQVAELRKQLTAKPTAAPGPAKVVEKAILKDAQIRRLEVAVDRARDTAAALLKAHAKQVDALSQRLQVVVSEAGALRDQIGAASGAPQDRHHAQPSAPVVPGRGGNGLAPVRRPPATVVPRTAGDARIGSGERAVLTAVCQYPSGAARDQLTVLTGYKRSSRDTYLQRLRAAGLVVEGSGLIFGTDAALAALGRDFEPLPTGEALRDYWLGRLPEGERRIFEVVTRAYPKAVERTALDEATGYRRSSRDTYLQRLSSRRLIEQVGRGEVRASEQLFL